MPKRSNAPNFLAIFGKRRLGRTISVIFLLLVIIAWIHFGHGPSKHSSEQQRIRKMMKHAWSGYYKYAKGSDELMPISKKGYNWTRESLQFTAVDSMDTLLIMDLNEEFEQAKNLVLQYDFNLIDYPINHFETNIRVLGGLLSANEFAPDKRFVILAEDLGDRLLKAFETPTGLPMMYIDLANGTRAMGGSFLATVGTLQLEFQYLSDLTGNKKYQDKALYVYEQLHFMNKPIPGLFPQQIDSTELQFGPDVYGIAANTDSFYEYLLKMYISTGMEKFKTWYEIAANAVVENLLVSISNYHYLPDLNFGDHESKFHHLSCFAGGMFALGAKSFKSSPNYTNDYFGIGANVTETCVKMYQQSITGLGGETARVYNGRIELSDAKYTQRPEVIESVFYMWRFTHDEKYRKYGREILNAMDKWIYDSVAYHDLSSENTPVDRMESFFLAETLKYLYLLFSDDDVIPLDKYVFNTEAHPLSIRGKGRRSDPSKWVPIKETSEYTPPVGSIRPPGASNILKPIPQLKSMSVVVSGPEPKIE